MLEEAVSADQIALEDRGKISLECALFSRRQIARVDNNGWRNFQIEFEPDRTTVSSKRVSNKTKNGDKTLETPIKPEERIKLSVRRKGAPL